LEIYSIFIKALFEPILEIFVTSHFPRSYLKNYWLRFNWESEWELSPTKWFFLISEKLLFLYKFVKSFECLLNVFWTHFYFWADTKLIRCSEKSQYLLSLLRYLDNLFWNLKPNNAFTLICFQNKFSFNLREAKVKKLLPIILPQEH
jgi:hypothetical protein